MQKQGRVIALIVEFESNVTVGQINNIPGVEVSQVIEGFKFRVVAKDAVDLRPEIFRFAADNNLSLIGLKQEESSLENIFRELTSPTEVQV